MKEAVDRPASSRMKHDLTPPSRASLYGLLATSPFAASTTASLPALLQSGQRRSHCVHISTDSYPALSGSVYTRRRALALTSMTQCVRPALKL